MSLTQLDVQHAHILTMHYSSTCCSRIFHNNLYSISVCYIQHKQFNSDNCIFNSVVGTCRDVTVQLILYDTYSISLFPSE